MKYTRISADSHIDLPMLAPELFTSNASAALKERMPYVTDGPDGPYWTCRNGGSFGLLNGVGPAGHKLVPGQNHQVDAMAATGFYDDGKRGRRHPTDPACGGRTWIATGCRPRSSSGFSVRRRGSTMRWRQTRCSEARKDKPEVERLGEARKDKPPFSLTGKLACGQQAVNHASPGSRLEEFRGFSGRFIDCKRSISAPFCRLRECRPERDRRLGG